MTTVLSNHHGPAVPPGVTVIIDGFQITVPKGTLIIRAAELLGIQIPRFCDHPLLEPVGACRQCLVQVEGGRDPRIEPALDEAVVILLVRKRFLRKL